MPPFTDKLVHKALSSDTRKSILLALAKKDKYLSEIADELNKKPQTIDFHINLLAEIGLVESRWQEGKKYYSLSEPKIIEFIKKHKPLPHHLHPKPPHEIVLDMQKEMIKRFDKIEQRLKNIEQKLK